MVTNKTVAMKSASGPVSRGRPKKDGQHINCYIKREIAEQLDTFCETTGLPKTVAVEHSIRYFLEQYEETGRL